MKEKLNLTLRRNGTTILESWPSGDVADRLLMSMAPGLDINYKRLTVEEVFTLRDYLNEWLKSYEQNPRQSQNLNAELIKSLKNNLFTKP